MAIEIDVIGGFSLRTDARPAEVNDAVKRVLAVLAVMGPLGRRRLAGLLWPDRADARAEANLRTVLWRLRGQCAGIVTVGGASVQLADFVQVDLVEERSWCERMLAGAFADGDLEHDLRPCADDLLAGWYDDWVVVEQERFRQVRLHAVEALAHHLLARDRFSEALDAALLAIATEPLRESAHRIVVRSHLAEGNASEALRAYRHYCQLATRELGLAPSAAMQALVAPLRLRRPWAETAPASPTTHPGPGRVAREHPG